jgi:hypothetical protein
MTEALYAAFVQGGFTFLGLGMVALAIQGAASTVAKARRKNAERLLNEFEVRRDNDNGGASR